MHVNSCRREFLSTASICFIWFSGIACRSRLFAPPPPWKSYTFITYAANPALALSSAACMFSPSLISTTTAFLLPCAEPACPRIRRAASLSTGMAGSAPNSSSHCPLIAQSYRSYFQADFQESVYLFAYSSAYETNHTLPLKGASDSQEPSSSSAAAAAAAVALGGNAGGSFLSVVEDIQKFENSLLRLVDSVREKRQVLTNVVGAVSADPSPSAPSAQQPENGSSRPPKVTSALSHLVAAGETIKRDTHAALDQILSQYFKIDLSALFEIDVANVIRSFRAVGPDVLCQTVEAGDLEDLALLLRMGADLDGLQEGETALMKATKGGNLEACQMLVEAGADMEAQSAHEGFTALHIACDENPQPNIARYLLSQGVNVNATSGPRTFAETPLHCAAFEGHTELVELLLSQGAELYALDTDEMTALHHAVYGGKRAVAALLIDKGIGVNERDRLGRTALHYTTREEWGPADNVEIAELLLSHGADIEVREIQGVTVLHMAALYGSVRVARVLLERGADVSAVDDTGRTALHWSVETRDSVSGEEDEGEGRELNVDENVKLQIAQILVDHGIDTEAENHDGFTAAEDAEFALEEGDPLREYLLNLPADEESDSDLESDSGDSAESSASSDSDDDDSEEEDEDSSDDDSSSGGGTPRPSRGFLESFGRLIRGIASRHTARRGGLQDLFPEEEGEEDEANENGGEREAEESDVREGERDGEEDEGDEDGDEGWFYGGDGNDADWEALWKPEEPS
uniref:Uncharacterized protein n=1 Tax=Chromera velia CCMP2878 TaxID=1169474 RepID=A0A0G4HHJ5_9ALVE|eukprot:Cvel_27664.t1-p1 / transcript=Cvel_27664.t1 / gene=Cvel_27664 / organism=Chromera_velia_CCMP2878 / gene_product=Putative ankyrin repeat protein RF_0381, putative / transcript_product=Putative ankyrin repeat protein RF_0381, putative / location=Cvel_scaffold3486:5293-8564(+) / protein_length=748 / sequence_SO=supercontig / SO=protein_coding / is_pseudo=false